jgi:hypothetical protein
MSEFKSFTAKLIGASPLLMHNANILVNPRNPITKLIKQYTGKRKKVDEDLDVISQLEWYASLYLLGDHALEMNGSTILFTDNSKVCLPATVIKGMLIAAARKKKLGTTFNSGIIIPSDFLLQINNKYSTNELWQEPSFVDVRAERVQKSAVMRTRPIFRTWAVEIEIAFMPEIINVTDLTDILNLAGKFIGLCDRRPEFGRFVAEF